MMRYYIMALSSEVLLNYPSFWGFKIVKNGQEIVFIVKKHNEKLKKKPSM